MRYMQIAYQFEDGNDLVSTYRCYTDDSVANLRELVSELVPYVYCCNRLVIQEVECQTSFEPCMRLTLNWRAGKLMCNALEGSNVMYSYDVSVFGTSISLPVSIWRICYERTYQVNW